VNVCWVDLASALPFARIVRSRPDWLEADFDQTYLNESEEAEPVPEFEFDQTVSW
jgi:hypothetical protein